MTLKAPDTAQNTLTVDVHHGGVALPGFEWESDYRGPNWEVRLLSHFTAPPTSAEYSHLVGNETAARTWFWLR